METLYSLHKWKCSNYIDNLLVLPLIDGQIYNKLNRAISICMTGEPVYNSYPDAATESVHIDPYEFTTVPTVVSTDIPSTTTTTSPSSISVTVPPN